MTKEEYHDLKEWFYDGKATPDLLMDHIIELYYDNLELMTKVQDLQGRIYELEATLDGPPNKTGWMDELIGE